MNKKTNPGLKIICLNRKASFNYFFEDLLEAGIVLKGSEIKSIRDGKINIADSYAVEKNGELILINSHISAYKQASYSNHNPTDERKLLLNKKEINKLIGKMQRDGFTIVPTKMYFKKGKAKVELAVAKGKNIFLAIGSNLGNRIANIEKAKSLLLQNNINFISVSNYYETPSWPDPNKPKFLNIVLKVFCNLNPLELLNLCKIIEVKLGRKKTYKNSPRTCDIDIIDFDGIVLKGKLNLPHPRMHERSFVLFPLFDLEKNWVHPVKKTNIKKLIFSLSNKDIRSINQI